MRPSRVSARRALASLTFASLLGLLARPARSETIDTLPMPAAKSIETAMVSNGTTGWLAISFGSNETHRYTTDGTASGTLKRSSVGVQRLRYFGLASTAPIFVSTSLASDTLCTTDAAENALCTPPASVKEASMSSSADLYPAVDRMFPLSSGAVYASLGKYTNGAAGGDPKLDHVGLYTPPSSASSVYVVSPSSIFSPPTAKLLGVAGGKVLFQRSDDATKLYVVDGSTVSSRAVTTGFDYGASPRAAARVIARGLDGKIYGVDALAQEELGTATLAARQVFGAKTALLVSTAAGLGIWITDGTAAGTTKLSLTGTSGFQLLATSTRLFALVSDGTKLSIWTTDGSAAPVAVFTGAVGDTLTLLGARGATAYFGVTPTDGATTTLYATSGGTSGSFGSVSGRVQSFTNVVDVVDRSPTVGDAVVAWQQSGGLIFIHGDTVVPDAGMDASDAADTALDVMDVSPDASDDAASDTAFDAPADSADDVAPEDGGIDDGAADASGDAPGSGADAAGDAGAATTDESNGGCGCTIVGADRERAANGLALALAGLVVARRRRARR